MAGADAVTTESSGCGFYPYAVVSTAVPGQRTVRVALSASAPRLKVEEVAVTTGGPMGNLEVVSSRLLQVEKDVAAIQERLQHMPTKLEVEQIITRAQGRILLGIGGVLATLAAKWLWEAFRPLTG